MTTQDVAPQEQIRILETWLVKTTMFVVTVGDHQVKLTRYDNHNRLLPNGKWVAAWSHSNPNCPTRSGSLSDDHLAGWDGERWVWRYKVGHHFDTYQQAYGAARKAEESRREDMKKEEP